MKTMNCAAIKEQIQTCTKCALSKTRTNAVSGEGCSDADILFIGEAPGRNEDLQGRPFVGRAGKLLDELLQSIDLTRETVFITNIIKCRPPKNRNPKTAEITKCTPYLDAQINCITPTVLVPLGTFATRFVCEKYGKMFTSIGELHGRLISIHKNDTSVFVFPMYHPAAAIYNPNLRTTLQKDFFYLKKKLAEIQR